MFEGEALPACPATLVTKQSWMLLFLFSQLGNKILPNEGGWLDQPNLYVDAIFEIARLEAESDASKTRRGQSPSHTGR